MIISINDKFFIADLSHIINNICIKNILVHNFNILYNVYNVSEKLHKSKDQKIQIENIEISLKFGINLNGKYVNLVYYDKDKVNKHNGIFNTENCKKCQKFDELEKYQNYDF